MDNPGVVPLLYKGSAFLISSLGAGIFIGDVADGLDGMLAASIEIDFAWGSGGTSCTAYIQTSLDKGQTWIDIAAVAFTTASGIKIINLSGLTSQTTPLTPSQQQLTAGTCVDGILGDRLRAVAVVVGTYGSSTLLSIMVNAR